MNKKCKYCKYKEDLNGITGCFYMGADCKHGEMYEPFTNADRFRVKTDEELAKYLVEIGWDCNLCSEHERLENEPLLRGEKCDNDCEKHCLEWLQTPAEEV